MESYLDPIAHRNLAVLEAKDPKTVKLFLTIPEIRAAIWWQLDDRRVIVDPTAIGQIAAALKGEGLAPSYSVDLETS